MYHVSSEIKDLGMGVVLTRKQRCYKKKTEQGEVYKTGFHMFVFGVLVSKQLALKIRQTIIEGPFLPSLLSENKILNPPHDVLDKSVCPFGKNGLLMLADYKGRNTGNAYSIFFKGTYNYSTDGWNHPIEYQPEQTVTLLRTMKNIFWDWLWNAPNCKKFGETEKSVVVLNDHPKGSTQSEFNLPLFLAALGGWVPKHSDKTYQQIVYFCKSLGLDPAFVGATCNQAWNYTGNETENMMNNAMRPDSSEIGRGSMVRILNLHAKGAWDERAIFGRNPDLKFYNSYKNFIEAGKVYHKSEVSEFLQECVSYISSVKKFTWQSFIKKKDKHGNKIKTIVRHISKEAPFCGSDDFRVRFIPPKDIMLSALEDNIPTKLDGKNKQQLNHATKIHKLISDLEHMSDKKSYESVCNLLGDDAPPPSIERISRKITKLHLDCQLTRLTDITFRPYVGDKDPTSEDTLNTFSGFQLDRFSPSRVVNVKETNIWTYFADVWGWGDQNSKIMKYMLDLTAFFLQFPHIRSERIILLVSPEEGTGKTFYFKILDMIFKGYTSFHDSLETYLGRFNIGDNSKLVMWLDDIFGATKAQTRRIFPKVTCNRQKYEKKGESVIELEEFSNVFITSNQDGGCALHIKPGDRRQLILEASAKRLQDREFFAKVTADIEDLNVAHAWFKFLQERDIGKFHPTQDPPTNAKSKSISSCMVKSHSFFNMFFQDSDWITNYRSQNESLVDWVRNYDVRMHKGEIRVLIETRQLHKLYSRFVKEFFRNSKERGIITFENEIEKLGFRKTGRLSRNKIARIWYDITYSQFKKGMKKLYQEFEINTWQHEEDYETFAKELEECRDVHQWKY